MNTKAYQCIVVKEEKAVIQILLDRPQRRHAINELMVAELNEVLDEIKTRKDLRVVILGSTDHYFCSGADLAEGLGKYSNTEEQILNMHWPLLRRLAELPQILISAVPGVTAGIGCALVFNSDLVVMQTEAELFFAFSKIGLIADGGVHWFLREHLGYQKAFELLVEGGSINAQQCFEKGIVNRLVEDASECVNEAQKWAEKLANCAPIATYQSKRCLRQMTTMTLEQAVYTEAAAQRVCEQSEDAQEGIQAFLQKRPAHFKGK